jgi:hypothetical protein
MDLHLPAASQLHVAVSPGFQEFLPAFRNSAGKPARRARPIIEVSGDGSRPLCDPASMHLPFP